MAERETSYFHTVLTLSSSTLANGNAQRQSRDDGRDVRVPSQVTAMYGRRGQGHTWRKRERGTGSGIAIAHRQGFGSQRLSSQLYKLRLFTRHP